MKRLTRRRPPPVVLQFTPQFLAPEASVWGGAQVKHWETWWTIVGANRPELFCKAASMSPVPVRPAPSLSTEETDWLLNLGILRLTDSGFLLHLRRDGWVQSSEAKGWRAHVMLVYAQYLGHAATHTTGCSSQP